MASQVSGYSYDVFISYRQNDNKYDGWVTAFVHNLSLELEATIKEKVSVYFDIDPKDGLLETHSVDKSLDDKLKSLIFIPIISRTYCDIKSYAWQNEFCTFNRFAMEDKFGRDVRLSRGNFSSRILPVRIHELDPEDSRLIEAELGGPLRSIDFIYKSAGVNRPLRADEDHPRDNLNNTYYRDQINKVANAIAEIITSLKSDYESGIIEKETDGSSTTDTPHRTVLQGKTNKKTFPSVRRFIGLLIILIAVLAIVLRLFFPSSLSKLRIRGGGSVGDRITIAVLPLQNLTDDAGLNYLGIAGQEGIVNRLSFYNEDLNVRPVDLIQSYFKSHNIPYISSFSASTGSGLSRKLDAEVFLLGNINKSGKLLRLNVQLIDSRTRDIARSFQAEENIDRFQSAVDSIADKIRDFLVLKRLDKIAFKDESGNPYRIHFAATSPEAYRFHYLALESFYSFDYANAIRLDSQAVAIDTGFVAALVSLSWEYNTAGYYDKAKKWLLKAMSKREQMPPVFRVKLDYQYSALFETPEDQIKWIKLLQKMEDGNPRYSLILGWMYVFLGKYTESIPEFEKVSAIYEKWDSEPTDFLYYQAFIKACHRTGQNFEAKKVLRKAERNLVKGTGTADQFLKLAAICSDGGFYAKADAYFGKAISLEPGNPYMLIYYAASLIDNKMNVNEGLRLAESALRSDPGNPQFMHVKGWGLYRQHKYAEALEMLEKAYDLLPDFEIKAHIDSVRNALNRE